MKLALILTTTVLLNLTAIERLSATPSEHLASVPIASAQEKEVISLLQLGKTVVLNSQQIFIPLYNPTKYTLTSCVARVTVPIDKVDRVYYSDKTSIPPFKDGGFQIDAHLDGRKTDEIKIEIIGVTWAEKK